MNTLELINFINKSVSPFHAVSVISEYLDKNQFLGLKEAENWTLKANNTYYTTRNDGSIIAFKLPKKEVKSFKIVASHSDSPSFKIKPNNEINVLNYKLINTEVYGGPIISTWLDRPLGVAGRLFYSENGKVLEKLIDVKDACIIPNTAIHMNPDLNKGYIYDHQTELLPLYSLEGENFISSLSNIYNIKIEDILSYDLFLYNSDEGKVIGINKEFISSPRIDNLGCAFTTLEGFIEAKPQENVCLVYACFNHEEVGSLSQNGADSTFLIDCLNRIMKTSSKIDREAILQSSFIISADNAHAIHYGTQGKMDPLNRTYLNKGIVIKHSCNQAYTTDAYSKAVFINVLKKNNIPYQEFTNKSGSRGGSTLGSISQSHVSIPSIDIGLPQLAMHSSRELSGVKDISIMIESIKKFFEE